MGFYQFNVKPGPSWSYCSWIFMDRTRW